MTPRQKLTARWSLVGLGVVTLAIVVAGAASSGAASDTTEASGTSGPTPVGVEAATPVDSFLRERVYTGALVARRRSVVSFERGGKVTELLVEEGDSVTQDQPLARLDTRRLTAQRKQAVAELGQASAQLKELVAGPRQQTIDAARANLENLVAQRDLAKLRLERRERLVRTNSISREEYDEASYDYQAAAARAEAAARELDELEEGTREEQIEAQRARVAALEARLADINHEIDDAVLLAPYAGRIAKRRIDEGTVLEVGAPVFDLIEADTLEAWVGLPPRAAEKLSIGESTRVTINGGERAATVQSIRPELDPETRTQNVVLRLADAAGLVAGQVVRVGVRESVELRGYWAPTDALTPGNRGLWSLLVVDEEGRAATRPVEVIENDGDRSFVRGALTPGERIIVEGAHRVVAGQRVRAVSPQEMNPPASPVTDAR